MIVDLVALKEITTLITKGTTPTTVGCSFTDDGVNFIKAEAVTLDGRIDESVFVHIDSVTHAKLKRSQIEEGDLLFSIAGMKLGKTAIARKRHLPANTNQALAIIRANRMRVLPEYLHYYFLNPVHYRYINSLTAQAAQPNINLTDIGELPIRLPSLATQHRTVEVLSAYDDLIENNQRRIKILEEMARALYCEWFVNFRFPGHEKVPLVDSPLGPIPKGWEVTMLGELYNTSSGGTPSRKHPQYFEDGTTEWVKSQELLDGFIFSTEERITDEALENSSAKILPANTVLIALYGATIGKLGILAMNAATNQACCAVLQKSLAFGREFAFLTLLLNRERIIGLRLGAAQQNISQILLRNFQCVKPSDVLATQFSRCTAPLLDGILTLQRQIQNLRRTRDLLLPRLLSAAITCD